jgi:meso-butanediol dehydrogenase/(S,S)-butanediol dehydrogenase/diacetyl reductase
MTPETDVMAERRRRIAGRVAIVTGASGGVRRGIAHRLAAAGMRVVVSSRDAGRARTVAGELSTLGAESLAVQADVTVPEAVERLVSTAVERYRPLNLMCNNAALMYVTPFFDSTIEGWQRVFQVNVGGVLLGTQLAARQMRRQAIDPDTGCRGKIVNVSSPGAEVTVPTEAAYGASKAAVNHLTRNAAALLADDLISVTALYPGNVWEGTQRQLHQHAGDPPGTPAGPSARARLESWPTGRWQRPDQTGDMVVLIAAYSGMGLTGQVVVGHPHRHRL